MCIRDRCTSAVWASNAIPKGATPEKTRYWSLGNSHSITASAGSSKYSTLLEAVSYTHLDVYKRQQQDLAQVPDDRFLKRWLRQQHELRHDEFDPFDFANL